MKRLLLFGFLPFFIVGATPDESLHAINCFLKLKQFESLNVVSLLDYPVKMDVETSFCAKKGVTFKASPDVGMFYKGDWVYEPFQVEEDQDIKIRYTNTYTNKTSAMFLSHILKVHSTTPCYFDVDYNFQDNLEGKSINVSIILKREPSYCLHFPPFKLTTLIESTTEGASYIEFFKENMISNFGGFQNYHDDLQKRYDSFVEKQKTVSLESSFKIPLNIFTIWLTDPKNPKGLSERCQNVLRKNRDVLRKEDGWTHALCVNRLSDCPELIEFQPIIELEPLFNESPYQFLKPSYQAALAEKNYGKASDIGRLLVIHKFGGSYHDTDYTFLQPFKALHQLCSFYGGMESPTTLAPCNAFIGAKALHPVIKRYMELIAKGCDDLCLPPHLQNPVQKTLFETGPYCMAKAFHEAKGKDDVLFPAFIFYYPPYIPSQGGIRKSWPLSAVGYHEHFMDWVRR